MRSARTLASKLYQASGWYADAQRAVSALARASGRTPEEVATVLAATSPQTSVTMNVKATLAYLSGHAKPSGLLNRSWRAAMQGRASGPKVEAFKANLLGDESEVTLDVWAWRALGFAKAPKRKALWAEAKCRYVKAAEIAGVSPAEMQAGVWQTIRLQSRFVTNPRIGELVKRLAHDYPIAASAAKDL